MSSSSKSNHSYVNNASSAIRREIQRFESVHPSIYAIYDLIELIPNSPITQQIRDHVVCIEDSFVNSQEWTLSRSVPDLRLGIVGSLCSGKSALVHRYLTGAYMQEESPEGGRFKKEVVVDGQSHLLLIRDEGGLPELQFASWVDAVIFVFSLENEVSFNAVYTYFAKLAYFRSTSDKDIPIILVGTQDAINENNPRIIDDAKARKLALDLRCPYYETCATYGLNVDRVFQDACQKIIQRKIYKLAGDSRPSTPGTPVGCCGNSGSGGYFINGKSNSACPAPSPLANNNHNFANNNNSSPLLPFAVNSALNRSGHSLAYKDSSGGNSSRSNSLTTSSSNLSRHPQELTIILDNNCGYNNNGRQCAVTAAVAAAVPGVVELPKELPTPTSTPTSSRKFRRRSNIFMTSSKKGEDKSKMAGAELGSGRAIPLKQGYLYKKSGKTLNKEWKKKYVTLCDDGRLTYHPCLRDYMDNNHGKEITLQYVTVKIPGHKPRGSKSIPNASASSMNEPFANLSISNSTNKESKCKDKVTLTAFEIFKDAAKTTNSEDSIMIMSNNSLTFTNGVTCGLQEKAETPNVKKRHRKTKAGVKNQEEDGEGFEFLIVSLNNKQWQFEADSIEGRNEWMAAIEQQILNSLQGNESNSGKSKLNSSAEAASIQVIRTDIAGNSICADCSSPNPDWASLNFGILMCIECSGIHRNLGSHVSKVRSLGLDEWPPSHLSVMSSVGNALANSIWEWGPFVSASGRTKPSPSSKREEKEWWIRSKYEGKEFLAPLPSQQSSLPLSQQLAEAIFRKNTRLVILLLVHSGMNIANAPVSHVDLRTPLHVACAVGNLAMVQLLLWYNADCKIKDQEGRTCLSYLDGKGPQDVVVGGDAKAIRELLIANGCSSPQQAFLVDNSNASSGYRELQTLPSSII